MSEFNTDDGKKWLNDLLKSETAVVSFKKKDGTIREMKCTLKEDVIKSYDKKTERVKEPNSEVLPVWDIDKGEWRSFRYDSISSVSFGLLDK